MGVSPINKLMGNLLAVPLRNVKENPPRAHSFMASYPSEAKDNETFNSARIIKSNITCTSI
jgi:hypothetical protein